MAGTGDGGVAVTGVSVLSTALPAIFPLIRDVGHLAILR